MSRPSTKALGLPGNPNFTNSSEHDRSGRATAISAHNNFIGPQFGAGGDFRLDQHWSISGDAKVAVGANFETLSVNGSTTSTVTNTVTPTQTILLAGISACSCRWHAFRDRQRRPSPRRARRSSSSGIFASAANSGSHSRTVFAYIPSSTFKLNYDVLPNYPDA